MNILQILNTDADAAEIQYLIEDLEAHHAAALRADLTFWHNAQPGTVEEQIARHEAVRERRYGLEAALEEARAALEAADGRIAA